MSRCGSCGGDNDAAATECAYCGTRLLERRRLDVAWTATASRGLVGLGRLELDAPLTVTDTSARAIAQAAFVVITDRLGPDAPRERFEAALREHVEALLPDDCALVAFELSSFELPRPEREPQPPAPARPRAEPPEPPAPVAQVRPPMRPAQPPPGAGPPEPRRAHPGLLARFEAWARALVGRMVKAALALALLGGGYALWATQLQGPPRSGAPSGGASGVDPLAEGMALLERGAFVEAERALSRALERTPTPAAWAARARARLERGDPTGALDDYGRALEHPTAALHTARGQLLAQLGRPAEALADLDRALALDPTHAPALYRRGLVHKARGEPRLALADFQAYLTQHPDDPVALYNRGLAHEQLAQLGDAIRDYRRALELKPDHRPARTRLQALEAAAR